MAEQAVKTETQSPPLADIPVRHEADEPRVRLHQLAEILRNGISRQLLVEYMQLRRALR